MQVAVDFVTEEIMMMVYRLYPIWYNFDVELENIPERDDKLWRQVKYTRKGVVSRRL